MKDRALQIIRETPIIALGTITPEGHPWVSPLCAVFDEGRTSFYWVSNLEDQHTKNIKAYPEAYIVIYDSSGTHEIGVYIEASAKELVDDILIKKAQSMLRLRSGKQQHDDLSWHSTWPHSQRVYEATIQRAWMNEPHKKDAHTIRDHRVSVTL